MKTRWTVLIRTRGGFKVANARWADDGSPTIAWTFVRANAEKHANSTHRRVVDVEAVLAAKSDAELQAVWDAAA